MTWYDALFKPAQGPDRVERLLSSCRSYYLNGDLDIAVILLREIEKDIMVSRGDTMEIPMPRSTQ